MFRAQMLHNMRSSVCILWAIFEKLSSRDILAIQNHFRYRHHHRGQLHVYRKHYCDIQPWARAVHPYCSAYVDSAFYPPRDGKMSISFRVE